MSSVLKKLREVADMRELGYVRRDKFRYDKWLAQDPDRAQRLRFVPFKGPQKRKRKTSK